MTTKKTTSKTTPAASTDQRAGHPLTLNGETVMLVPSGRAMMDISQAFGGLLPALERVRAYDVTAIGAIVHVALGRPKGNAALVEKTMMEVCKGDLTDAALAVVAYLSEMISGRPEAQKPAA